MKLKISPTSFFMISDKKKSNYAKTCVLRKALIWLLKLKEERVQWTSPLGQDIVLYKFYVRLRERKNILKKKANCSNWHLIREVHSLVTTDFRFWNEKENSRKICSPESLLHSFHFCHKTTFLDILYIALEKLNKKSKLTCFKSLHLTLHKKDLLNHSLLTALYKSFVKKVFAYH